MSDWIRIVGPGADTRRPEEGVEVLCYYGPEHRRFVGTWYNDPHPRTGEEFWCDAECTYVPVTDWMPLPDPPTFFDAEVPKL